MKNIGVLLCILLLSCLDYFECRAEDSWPSIVSAPDFLPGCAEMLLERPVLFRGGGIKIDEENSWLALGVGTAPLNLENGRKQSEDNAWKVANAKAIAALAEALWGTEISAQETVFEKSDEKENGVRIIERTNSLSESERKGVLAGSREVGRWRLYNGSEVGVLRIIASPNHPIEQITGWIPVVSEALDPAWRDLVLTLPILRFGGVAATQHQGKTWLFVTGTTRVKKDVTFLPPEAMQVAEAKARAEWLRFAQGVRIQERERAEMMIERIQIGDTPALESIRETLYSSTEAQVQGWSRGMTPTGSWLSDAGDSYRLVVVFRMSF